MPAMPKRTPKHIPDPSDIEVYPTVAGFEIALRMADAHEGKQYFEIVLRSLDRTSIKSLLLTQNKRNAASRLMDYHAGACAMQHISGVKIDRRAA
jgi:hypothetical protein